MIDVRGWSWVINTKDMTCKSVENEVIIKMERDGENLKAILYDMPIWLFAEISGYGDGEKVIEEIIRTAGEKYLGSHTQA